jgi:hypothetical protein
VCGTTHGSTLSVRPFPHVCHGSIGSKRHFFGSFAPHNGGGNCAMAGSARVRSCRQDNLDSAISVAEKHEPARQRMPVNSVGVSMCCCQKVKKKKKKK